MKNTKSNTVLPEGAKLLKKPITRGQTTYDAQIYRWGVRWLRVKDGLGGRNEREDWWAQIDGTHLMVHDYHWNGEDFGANHGSFENACDREMQACLASTKARRKEYLKQIKVWDESIALMEKCLSYAP